MVYPRTLLILFKNDTEGGVTYVFLYYNKVGLYIYTLWHHLIKCPYDLRYTDFSSLLNEES